MPESKLPTYGGSVPAYRNDAHLEMQKRANERLLIPSYARNSIDNEEEGIHRVLVIEDGYIQLRWWEKAWVEEARASDSHTVYEVNSALKGLDYIISDGSAELEFSTKRPEGQIR